MSKDGNLREDEANARDAFVEAARATRAPTRSVRYAVVALIAVVAGASLIVTGAYWHQPLARRFGLPSARDVEERLPADSGAGNARQLWTCGMHPQVIQDHPGDCPICHMKLTPLAQEDDADEAKGPAKIAYWWDPMIGPASISSKPGKSAMGMDLVPVMEDAVSGGTSVKIDPVVVQNMGVRVATVERGKLRQTIRAVGFLAEAQPLIRDVNLRVSGWIDALYAATEGQHVDKGAPLFNLYSPDVQVAVQELIAVRRSAAGANSPADALEDQTARTLVQSSREKLAQWGLDDDQISRLANLDQAPRTITFYSPIDGHVTIKNVVTGSAVKAGDRVLQLVDHSVLWLDVQVYEQDLPYIKLGQEVSATVEAMPGHRLQGKIIFIHPHVDPATRTALARVELPNPDMRLRPGMYAAAEINSQLSDDALLVPREAIIDTGTRAVAFVTVGDGRFEPRNVVVGASGDDGRVQILSGLAPGDLVVTSGEFLLDAESRLREAIQRHLGDQLLIKSSSTADAGSKMTGDSATNTAGTTGAGMRGMPEMTQPPAVLAPGTRPATLPATRGAAASSAWSADVDEVYNAYLQLAHDLVGPEANAVNVRPLLAVASRLADAADGAQADLPRRIRDAASAMDGKSLPEQRKGFKSLSDAVVAMVQVSPPSAAIGPKLVVAHCPMAFGTGADWLQTSTTIMNPYLPTMVDCGEVTRTVTTVQRQ